MIMVIRITLVAYIIGKLAKSTVIFFLIDPCEMYEKNTAKTKSPMNEYNPEHAISIANGITSPVTRSR